MFPRHPTLGLFNSEGKLNPLGYIRNLGLTIAAIVLFSSLSNSTWERNT